MKRAWARGWRENTLDKIKATLEGVPGEVRCPRCGLPEWEGGHDALCAGYVGRPLPLYQSVDGWVIGHAES